jgi:hypothetical protein
MTRTSGFLRAVISTTVRHLEYVEMPPRIFICMTWSPWEGRLVEPKILGLSKEGRRASPGSTSVRALARIQNIEIRAVALDRISVSCTERVAQTPRGRVANTKTKSSFLDVWLPIFNGDGGGEVMRMARATTQKEVAPPELGRRYALQGGGVGRG